MGQPDRGEGVHRNLDSPTGVYVLLTGARAVYPSLRRIRVGGRGVQDGAFDAAVDEAHTLLFLSCSVG